MIIGWWPADFQTEPQAAGPGGGSDPKKNENKITPLPRSMQKGTKWNKTKKYWGYWVYWGCGLAHLHGSHPLSGCLCVNVWLSATRVFCGGVVLRVTHGGCLLFATSQHLRVGGTPGSRRLLAWPAVCTRLVDRTPQSTSPGHPGGGGAKKGQQVSYLIRLVWMTCSLWGDWPAAVRILEEVQKLEQLETIVYSKT